MDHVLLFRRYIIPVKPAYLSPSISAMKQKILILFSCLLICGFYVQAAVKQDTVPSMLKGKFTDDYGIRYMVTDTLWTQLPNVKYHIISWNVKEQYLLARNDHTNPSEPGLYTRIDFMHFSNMEPFLWGFCLTTYDATSVEEAETKAKADRAIPKKGCNGYPFSRMKRID